MLTGAMLAAAVSSAPGVTIVPSQDLQ